MNIKQSLSSFGFGLLLLATACTNESEQIGPNIPDPGTDDPDRREVLLTLKNDLQLKPVGTKAAGDPIATADENYIQSLDVYVFGSKAENDPAHPYTFQELHYYRDDASELPTDAKVKSFPFSLANTSGNAQALLKLNKGLFVKLYVVANRTHLYQTAADGTTLTEYTDFQSLLQDKPGQADNIVVNGKPTLADFLKLHTQRINPANAANPTADDILNMPLPMTGAYTTPLDLTDFGTSARTQISFKLSRMVARFDIVNDATKSKFTVEKISMGGGRSGAKFFPIEVLPQAKADLISYPERPLSALTQKADHTDPDPAQSTTSVSKGAFYTWPSPNGDEGYLVLKGKYAVNMTDVRDVSYRIPFQQVVNGVGSYIEVAYNHRYTIAITKADDYHLDFTLVVEDWDDTETGMEYNPDNDFDKGANIVLTTGVGENVGAYVIDNGNVELLPLTGSKFAFKMGSNTPLREEIVYKEGSAEWVKIEDARKTKATSMDSLYTYVIDDAVLADASRLLPVTIRLTNPASGIRKEIKVVPTPGPVVTWTKGTDPADMYNMFDPATHTATIYNVDGQTIKLHVVAATRTINDLETTGSTATIPGGDTWLTSSGNIGAAEGDYTLTLGAAQTGSPLPGSSVTFTSTASAVATPVTVKLKDAKMKALDAADFVVGSANELAISGGNGGIPKVTLSGVANNSFTLTVTSPEGTDLVIAPASGWLTATKSAGQTLPNGMKTATITGKITDATGMGTTLKADGKITITNKLDATEKYEVEVHTKLPAAPVVTMKTVAGNLSTYVSETHTATLYNAVNQTITLVTDIATTATSAEDWLTLSTGSTTEHLITLNAATGTPGITTGAITFTSASGSVQSVTVALADPAITALVAGDFTSTTGTNTFAVAADPDNAKVTMTEATAASAFTFKVKSKGGISVDNTAVTGTSSWLTVTETLEEDASGGGKEATLTVTIKAGTVLTAPITDGKIVLANAITGGGNLTIDVVTTVAPIIP